MRTKCYISGPLTSSGDPQANLQTAIEAHRELMQAGFAPLCPHLTLHVDPHAELPHDDWMAVDIPWVLESDCLLRLPGESKGADIEVCVATEAKIPVYHSISELLERPPLLGSQAFRAKLRALRVLHSLKATDYGSDDDPFANIRASANSGIEPWRGAWVRASDKVFRMNRYCNRGSLANEGVTDTLEDLASYCLITSILHEERCMDIMLSAFAEQATPKATPAEPAKPETRRDEGQVSPAGPESNGAVPNDQYVVFERLGHRVIVDPQRMFGDAFLESCGYQPCTLADAVDIEGGIDNVARIYGVDRSAVEASLLYVHSLIGEPVTVEPGANGAVRAEMRDVARAVCGG